MNKFRDVALSIKEGDINRKNFFKDMIKKELKQYLLEPTDEQLEILLMEATDEYLNKNINSIFIFYCQNYILERLTKINNINIEGNELFSKREMIIMNLYLNNERMSSESIAEMLDISVIDVNNTINKAKKYYSENRRQILDLFPNYIDKTKKENMSSKINAYSITKKDIELLGCFTGQINDICLDIDELANQNYTTKKEIEKKLKKIITSLKNKTLYSYLLREFPNIEEILVIKAKSLDLNPKTFLPKEIAEN